MFNFINYHYYCCRNIIVIMFVIRIIKLNFENATNLFYIKLNIFKHYFSFTKVAFITN